MKRVECYLMFLVLLSAILLCSFALWIKLDLNQSASSELISAIDENSKKREIAMARQIQAGLDKSDGIATNTQNIAKDTKAINDHQTDILGDIQKLLKGHTAPLQRAARASEEAAHAAKVSASASKKAVKEVEHKPLIERIFK